jgi:galactokinase
MEDKLEVIFEGLKQKSITKQTIFRNTTETFNQLRECASSIVDRLSKKVTELDSTLVIEYRSINDFEFHIKFSGDLLIFVMHSNIVTFPEEH